MKLANFFLLFALLCFGHTAFAQPTNNNLTKEKKENIADEELNQNNSQTALEWYMKAYESNNKDAAVIFKIASTHEILRDYKNASEWYKKLVDLNQIEDYPIARYQYANALKMNGNYDAAITEFETFSKNYSDNSPQSGYYKTMARVQLDGAKMAKANPATDEELIIENAGDVINSPSTEGGAFPVGREKIIYASLKTSEIIVLEEGETDYEHAKIYEATSDGNGAWKDVKEFNAETLQKEGFHVVQPMFNKDRTKFYFVRAELMGNQLENSRIYVADYNSGAVTNPKMLDFNSNTYSCKNPAIATWDGKDYLLFVSNMEGGKGGTDIWYAEINADGTTKEPLNLEAINTIGDEVTPFFDERSNTLYFSTDGRPGYGGWDIFYTTRSNNGSMSEIKNMGPGFNTFVDDFHFILNKEGNDDCYAYVLSNRPGTTSLKNETCCDDIFTIIMPERCDIVANIELVNADTREPLVGATLQLINKKTGQVIEEQTNTEGNDYSFNLKMNEEYELVAKKDGQPAGTKVLDTRKQTLIDAGKDITKPMTIEETIPLEDEGLLVQVFNKRTNESLEGVTVKVFDGTTGKEIAQQTNASGNEFKFTLARNKPYKVFAKRQGFIADTRIVSAQDMNLPQKLYLTPPPVFYNVYFDFDKSNIRPGAADTLDIVYRTLDENPEMIVEVRGHTDAKGTNEYNDRLSVRRAKMTIDYLAKKGVSENRLVPKGFGEERPAADNTQPDGSDNPEGRALNRRVEFKIVDGTLGFDERNKAQEDLASTPVSQTGKLNVGSSNKLNVSSSNKLNTNAEKMGVKPGDQPKTTLSFASPVMKIGPVKFGTSKEYTVEFTNTGKHDFKIFHLEGGCICTTPTDWSRGAIKPGEKGFITFKFDSSKAKVDPAYASSLNIYGNVPDDMILYDIEANVTE